MLLHSCSECKPWLISRARWLTSKIRPHREYSESLTAVHCQLTVHRYYYPAVDIKGGLNNISSGIQKGTYTNEYDFQNDIYNLIYSAYDQHFNYLPDITQIFSFYRTNNLFSVSTDGQALLEVYMDLDLGVLGNPSWKNYTVSPVTKINGQPVENYLNKLAAELGGAQDPDANYNALFPVIPLQSTGQASVPAYFAYSPSYQGSSTEVTFQNGTTRKITTFASTSQSFQGVTDGASFFQKFCSGATPSSSSASPSASLFPSMSAVSSDIASASASASAVASFGIPLVSTQVSYSAVPSQTAVPALQFFPKAWVAASDFSIACYFPEENTDLAVLSVPTFEPMNDVQFADVTRKCLATASRKGKSKLIIDLRGNGGGTVLLAYDMFKQLFPSKAPYGTTNFRAFDLFNDIGQTVTEYYESDSHGRETLNNNFGSIFNVDDELNSMNQQFKTWEAFYGPVHTHNDTFTNLARYNLSDPVDTGGIAISGYENLTNIVPKQTFSSDNIVLLQDGACASTCSVFAEFMKTQGLVKSVAIGGRSQYGPMQGDGGVKGANVYTNDYLLQIMQEAFTKDADRQKQRQLASKYQTEVTAMYYATTRAYFGSQGHAARVNIRNNIRKGDTTLTPLQFVYEAANCRLFYTPAMILDQTLVWSATSKAQWAGGVGCVKNSTVAASANPGVGHISEQDGGSQKKKSGAARPSMGLSGMGVSVAAACFAFLLL